MGYRRSWDVGEILSSIGRISRECGSSYNDGFTAFEAKKDLLEIKFFLEDCLERCPRFIGEEEIYQQRLVKKLKE